MYRAEIDSFVGLTQNRDSLRRYELTDEDWSAIEMVTEWLLIFREATLQMSTTKHCTLSHVHAIFKGLQKSICQSIKELPNSAPDSIQNGLVNAHRKLSDYYFKFDESPYYIWAASTLSLKIVLLYWYNSFLLVLDPRIGYSAFRADCDDDRDLQQHVDDSLADLQAYYNIWYAPTTSNEAPSRSQSNRPGKFDFLARYDTSSALFNEFEDFLRLPKERWNGCDPILWWGARRKQFPNLSRLARDILSIPGKYISLMIHLDFGLTVILLGSSVAVERIFSGGRDMIALRRSSLKPDTIQALMVLKNRLLLARHRIHRALAVV